MKMGKTSKRWVWDSGEDGGGKNQEISSASYTLSFGDLEDVASHEEVPLMSMDVEREDLLSYVEATSHGFCGRSLAIILAEKGVYATPIQ